MVIDKIRKIETSFDVDKIVVNNEQIWPIIRTHVAGLLYEKEDATKRNKSLSDVNIFKLIMNSSRGLLKLISGNFEYLFFSKAERRKLIGGQFHERVIEGTLSIFPERSLLIESPIPTNHYPINKTKTKNLSSESFLYIVQGGLMLFLKCSYSGVQVINKIEDAYGIKINYKYLFLRYQAQYISMRWLLKRKNAKAGFFVAPNLYSGYIKAFKEKNIPVVEMQHGVINESHYAYSIFHSIKSKTLPDYLLTYGQDTKNLLTKTNNFIDAKCIIPIGSYFIEEIEAIGVKSMRFLEIKKKYNKTIAISGQEIIEKELIDFMIKVTQIDETILVIYIPRTPKNYDHYNLPNNIIACDWLNIYEAIILCDIHATFNSSCALEAPQLGSQNILIDFNNQASAYYGKVLSDEKITRFVTTPSEFVKALYSLPQLNTKDIRQTVDSMIVPNHKANMKNFLDNYL